MRVCDLYSQVSQLGFEDSLESDNRFYYAANRALLQVNTIRPAVKAYVINHKPMKNLIHQETFSPIEKYSELIFYGIQDTVTLGMGTSVTVYGLRD